MPQSKYQLQRTRLFGAHHFVVFDRNGDGHVDREALDHGSVDHGQHDQKYMSTSARLSHGEFVSLSPIGTRPTRRSHASRHELTHEDEVVPRSPRQSRDKSADRDDSGLAAMMRATASARSARKDRGRAGAGALGWTKAEATRHCLHVLRRCHRDGEATAGTRPRATRAASTRSQAASSRRLTTTWTAW